MSISEKIMDKAEKSGANATPADRSVELEELAEAEAQEVAAQEAEAALIAAAMEAAKAEEEDKAEPIDVKQHCECDGASKLVANRLGRFYVCIECGLAK